MEKGLGMTLSSTFIGASSSPTHSVDESRRSETRLHRARQALRTLLEPCVEHGKLREVQVPGLAGKLPPTSTTTRRPFLLAKNSVSTSEAAKVHRNAPEELVQAILNARREKPA
jgi:hypothetical protein